jgi:hypothetical protein
MPPMRGEAHHHHRAAARVPSARVRRLTWRVPRCWLALALAACTGLAAQTSREYDLKAVFLYNFASFVEWPEEPGRIAGTPFVIGVLGDDPFGAVLDDVIRGEAVRGAPLQVRRCRTLADVAGCRILFVSKTGAPPLAAVPDALNGRPVLTVGDNAQFVEDGGMIGFSTTSGRLQLHINARAARAAGLNISSKLLRVSKVTGEDAP